MVGRTEKTLMKGCRGSKVALEIVAGLDRLDTDLKLLHQGAHPLVALGLPLCLVLLGSHALCHGGFSHRLRLKEESMFAFRTSPRAKPG